MDNCNTGFELVTENVQHEGIVLRALARAPLAAMSVAQDPRRGAGLY